LKKRMICLFLLVMTTMPVVAQTSAVSIQLQDYRHPDALVYIAIYAATAKANWGDTPVKLLQTSLTTGDEMSFNADLPPGLYALRAFIDLDGDGELDTGAHGKPVEPFAFSRAAGAAKSLRFNAAVVDVGARNAVVLRFLHPKPAATAGAPAPRQ
jgi:uncharacterized protein (DUF2141 family)